MDRDAEFSACVDLLAKQLPAVALYELCLEEPVSLFRASYLEVTQVNVRERLTEAGLDFAGPIRRAIEDVLLRKGPAPAGMPLSEWVAPEIRGGTNPTRELVLTLLAMEGAH